MLRSVDGMSLLKPKAQLTSLIYNFKYVTSGEQDLSHNVGQPCSVACKHKNAIEKK
jgi:hypothetical protein